MLFPHRCLFLSHGGLLLGHALLSLLVGELLEMSELLERGLVIEVALHPRGSPCARSRRSPPACLPRCRS